MNTFHEALARVLEVDHVDDATNFRAVPGWCSLLAFGLLVTMENDWQTPLTIDDLRAMHTVGDLACAAFLAFAANLLHVDRQTLSPATTPNDLPAWDSVNHLRLVMEAEQRFGVHYDLEDVPELKTLGDFLAKAKAHE